MHQLRVHDFQIGLATDKGPFRERNEDASLAAQFVLVHGGLPPLSIGLFIVADGMGGHGHGDQASALACRLAAEHVIRQVHLPVLTEGAGTPINEVLEESVRAGHRAIQRQLPGAGTTLTMALVLGDDVHIAHVGDGRAYLGQPGRLRCLTHDHSMAERLLELGQAAADESGPERSVLYKAVGQRPEIEPDILHEHLAEGSYLLLCCDGLWGVMAGAEISAAIDVAPTPDAACRNLVAQAIERGGEDNITVLLAARGWPLAAGQEQTG
jgi:PPM family protein phosphatase